MSGECWEYKCFSKRVTALLQTTPGDGLRGLATAASRGPFVAPSIGARHLRSDDGVQILGADWVVLPRTLAAAPHF